MRATSPRGPWSRSDVLTTSAPFKYVQRCNETTLEQHEASTMANVWQAHARDHASCACVCVHFWLLFLHPFFPFTSRAQSDMN